MGFFDLSNHIVTVNIKQDEHAAYAYEKHASCESTIYLPRLNDVDI